MINAGNTCTVLIVDDDSNLRELINNSFKKENQKNKLGSISWEVFQSSNLNTEIKQLSSKFIDLVIQDLNLPDGNGLSVLSLNRNNWKNPNPKFLVLTTETDVKTRENTFQYGAQEYLPKPFFTQELLIRAKKILNIPICSNLKDQTKGDGFIKMPFNSDHIIINGLKVTLTPYEISIMKELLNSEIPLSSEILTERIATHSSGKFTISKLHVQVCITRLRQKFHGISGSRVIKTKRLFGYYV
jgi:DNA-binding response OmpR family regulator